MNPQQRKEHRMTTQNASYATFSEANFPVMSSTARNLFSSISGRRGAVRAASWPND